MRNAGLEEAQAGIKTAGRNLNNLRYADDTTFMAESEEELKKPGMLLYACLASPCNFMQLMQVHGVARVG